MSINKSEELSSWKSELEKQKADLIRRRTIIENKFEKYKLRLEILNSANINKDSDLYHQVLTQMEQYQKELKEFNEKNASKIMEIDTILQKITLKPS